MKTTYVSWKLFRIEIVDGQPVFNNNFDTQEANEYIQNERKFIEKLKKQKEEFDYIKIIPDDIVFSFWNVTNPGATEFKVQIEKYFQTQYQKTRVYLMSEITSNYKLERLYQDTFKTVFNSFDQHGKSKYVIQQQFKEEYRRRSIMYSKNILDKKTSKDLAKKAFALFAAERAVLLYLENKNVFPNLILLAGERSRKDIYKYEFYSKIPMNISFVL